MIAWPFLKFCFKSVVLYCMILYTVSNFVLNCNNKTTQVSYCMLVKSYYLLGTQICCVEGFSPPLLHSAVLYMQMHQKKAASLGQVRKSNYYNTVLYYWHCLPTCRQHNFGVAADPCRVLFYVVLLVVLSTARTAHTTVG